MNWEKSESNTGISGFLLSVKLLLEKKYDVITLAHLKILIIKRLPIYNKQYIAVQQYQFQKWCMYECMYVSLSTMLFIQHIAK